jgi:hypothetical protein
MDHGIIGCRQGMLYGLAGQQPIPKRPLLTGLGKHRLARRWFGRLIP